MRRNKVTIVGVLCGLACAVCVFVYIQGVRGEADSARVEALARYGGEQLEVCVAKQDIAAGETVAIGAVETRLWVADLLPEGAVRSSDSVLGRKVSSTVLAGEVLSERRFQDSGSHLDIPQGLTAVSVPAKDVQAVGGAVGAGSRADLYATGATSTDIIASDVLVLATSVGMSDGESSAKVSWITLAVQQEAVQEIVSAAQRTELYFTLPGSAIAGDSTEAFAKNEGLPSSDVASERDGDQR